MPRNAGKRFEEDFQGSLNEQGVWNMLIKDAPVHLLVRGASVSKNDYDHLIFYKGSLFPIEFKTTQQASITFEGAIDPNQTEKLTRDSGFEGVHAGFIFNFREYENKTYFIPIENFNKYKDNVDRKSFPLSACEELGFEIHSELKRSRYRYFTRFFLDEYLDSLE